MSTRGCIAIGTPDQWQGVYTHYDSYPTERGPLVWDAVRSGTYRFLIEQHPGGWSVFPRICYCHSPEFDRRNSDGIITHQDNDPLSIEWVYILDEAAHTLHILNAQDAGHILSKHEWDKYFKQAAAAQHGESFWACTLECRSTPVTFYSIGYAYYYALIASITLDGPAPDWQEIQDRADKEG